MSSSQHTDTSSVEIRAARPCAAPRSRLRILGSVLSVGLLAGAGWWLYYYQTQGQYLQSTDDAYLQADTVTIAPKVSGYVQEVLVKDNQDVQAGQPLVRIDSRDYDTQVAQAKASIEVAQATAAAGQAQIQEQEAAIAQAKAQLLSAQANAEHAAAQVRRFVPLVQTGAEPEEQLASRRNQEQQALAQLASQRATLMAAERRITSIKAQIQQAKAQAASAQAQHDGAAINAHATTITASISGRIGDRTVRPGQFVQQGTRLMSIVPMEQLYITANFKETQLARMRAGQPVQIRIDSLPQLTLRGHVDSIAPGTGAQFSLIPPQNATGNFTKIVQRVPVRIALDPDAQARQVLVPGLSVVVQVNTRSSPDRAMTAATLTDHAQATP